jgi:radical SAM superfamily enzyme YgiQ (UPF0313 family)
MRILLLSMPHQAGLLKSVPYGMAVTKTVLKGRCRINQFDLNAYFKVQNEYFDFYSMRKELFQYVCGIPNDYLKRLFSKIISASSITKYDSIGFSIHTSHSLFFALALAFHIKKEFGKKIVFGGSCLYSIDYNLLFKRFTFIDCINIGPIELTYNQVINSLKKHKRELIVSESYRVFGTIPDYEGLNLDIYKKKMAGEKRVLLPVPVSGGCPKSCSFCTNPKDYHMVNISEIVQNILTQKRLYNSNAFYLVCCSVNSSYHDCERLCEALSNLGIQWSSKCSSSNLDYNLIMKMSASGCVELEIGLESASDRIQRILNKKVDLQKFSEHVRHMQQHRIRSIVNVIVGVPTESESDFNITLRYIRENSRFIDRLSIHKFSLLKGSKIYNDSSKYGVNINRDNNYSNITGIYDFTSSGSSNISNRVYRIRKLYYSLIIRKKIPLLNLVPFGIFNTLFFNRLIYTQKSLSILRRCILRDSLWRD